MPLLVIDSGAHKGQRVALPATQEFLIGRDETANLRVQDKRASRLHCRIRSGPDQMMVEDMESRNGTLLNGFQLTRPEVLQIGDQLQIGDTVFTVLGDEVAGSQQADPWEGKELGGYRVLERVGRGGMGTVYRAVQKSLHREVALKVLSPQLASDPERIRNFVNEARAAGQLNHPNIVQVYDVQQAEADGVWFFSMEYAPSGSIMDALSAEGSLPPERALEVILDAARGLLYAEQKGIVHRDIKPDNLMIGAEGSIKIGDLGLAQPTEQPSSDEAGAGRERPAKVFGTPHYIAPEQAQGKAVDHRADLYSLGASFYRIIAGRPPFDGKSSADIVRKHLTEVAPPLTEVAPQVPRSFSRFTEKLMQKRPEDRYQSAADLIHDLEAIRRGDGKRKLVLAGIAATVLAVLGLLLALPGDRGGGGPVVVTPGPVTPPGPGPDVPTVVTGTGGPEGGGETPGPTPTEDPAETTARGALESIAAQELDATLMGNALAEAYRAVASAHEGTASAQEAEHRARRIETALAESRQAEEQARLTNDAGRDALSAALDQSRLLLEQRRYGQAIELVTAVQAEHTRSVAGRTAAPGYIALYRGQAEDDLATTRSRADQLAKKSDWERALDEIQQVIDLFGIPELTGEAEKLKQEIERQRQRAREEERRAQRERDRERSAALLAALDETRATKATRYAYRAMSERLSSAVDEFETPGSRASIARLVADYLSVAALLDELALRYERKGGLAPVSFPTPTGFSGRTSGLTFVAPGDSGFAKGDGTSFKVSFKVAGTPTPIVTNLKLSDFQPQELVDLLPRLWDLTLPEQLALARFAAAEGLASTAAATFERLAAQEADADVAKAARNALRALGTDIKREDEAADLIDRGLVAYADRDWATASNAFQKLARDFATTQAVASMQPFPGSSDAPLAAYLAACRKALEAASSGQPDRYKLLADWKREQQRAVQTAKGITDSLERRRDLFALGQLYQHLESFERALRYYQKYEETYRDTDKGEIESGRIFVRMAECFIYLEDDRNRQAALAKARVAPKVDQGFIDQCEQLAASFPEKWQRVQRLLEMRKESRTLSRQDQIELVNLFGQLRLEIGQRAEIFNLRENFEVDEQHYTWLLIDSHWNCGDHRAVRDLAPKFITDFPVSPQVTSGEAPWRAGESMRLLGKFRRALTFYKLVVENAPDSKRVKDGDVAKRIAECEKKSR